MLFIMSLNLTDQGIRKIKDDPKRVQASDIGGSPRNALRGLSR
jgi:uncharacterized protein with GYD domain